MKAAKKSFILHLDSLTILDELSNEQAGELFKKIYKYNSGEKPKETQKTQSVISVIDAVFIQFKSQFDRDLEKYDRVVNRNKSNGLLGGRPKKNNPKKPKKADSDNDSDNDIIKRKNKSIDAERLESEIPTEYLPILRKWLEYKKSINNSYKTTEGILSCYKNLVKWSNNNPAIAQQIVDKSIGNEYKGLFPLPANEIKSNAPTGTLGNGKYLPNN